jgi:Ca2+-binding EF-hand superfamily protein
MYMIVDAIYQMVLGPVEPSSATDVPRQRVDKLFERMDTNQDDRLTIDEFREGCHNDARIVTQLSYRRR